MRGFVIVIGGEDPKFSLQEVVVGGTVLEIVEGEVAVGEGGVCKRVSRGLLRRELLRRELLRGGLLRGGLLRGGEDGEEEEEEVFQDEQRNRLDLHQLASSGERYREKEKR